MSSFVLLLLGLVLLVPPKVFAFKPYTHYYAAEQVRQDALDGQVTLHFNGQDHQYRLRDPIARALRDYPAFFNSGVVGPDGFPDVAYGQSVIHPENTGKWLRLIYAKAWETYGSGLSEEQRLQALAFTYGFLMHAAGDLWAHTLVNDVARGIFPAVGEIHEKEKLAIVLRHVIVEGYIADATPGFDGNLDRQRIEGGASDDSTPAIPFDAPHSFIYDVLINTDSPTPSANRGPILDRFLRIRNELDKPEIKNAGAVDFDRIRELERRKKSVDIWCKPSGRLGAPEDPFTCIEVLARLNISVVAGDFSKALKDAQTTFETGMHPLVLLYLKHWDEDLERGIKNWSKLGLAVTKGLFDPKARRDAQDRNCAHQSTERDDINLGPTEVRNLREDCEDKITFRTVILDEADAFIKEHLLGMLGLPDWSADVLSDLQGLNYLIGAMGVHFQPILETKAAYDRAVDELIGWLLKEGFKFDIDAASAFINQPTAWLDVQSVNHPIFGSLQLFGSGDHAKIDQLLGIHDRNHHLPDKRPMPDFPVASTKLADDVIYNDSTVPIIHDTEVLGKLLLLDGAELNRVFDDILFEQGLTRERGKIRSFSNDVTERIMNPAGAVTTVSVPGNIMVHGLMPLDEFGNIGEPTDWLQSIDSDHAWRHDALPRFSGRPQSEHGGLGRFSPWESCLLRPAFPILFKDWENQGAQFPDLYDRASADVSDGLSPTSILVEHLGAVATRINIAGSPSPRPPRRCPLECQSNPSLPQCRDCTPSEPGGISIPAYFINRNTIFTLAASDEVFPNSKLKIQYQWQGQGGQPLPGQWLDLTADNKFKMYATARPGNYWLWFRSEDPCHTFDASDALEPEVGHSHRVYEFPIVGPTYFGPVTWIYNDQASLPNGTVATLDNKQFYIIDSGLKRWVPDKQTYDHMRVSEMPLAPLTQVDFNAIHLGPPYPSRADSNFLSLNSTEDVYVMLSGQRRKVPSSYTNTVRGRADIQFASSSDLHDIPIGPEATRQYLVGLGVIGPIEVGCITDGCGDGNGTGDGIGCRRGPRGRTMEGDLLMMRPRCD
jgi:hypothetical protein